MAASRPPAGAEALRLAEAQARTAHWKRWGPYLAERQWGTVREDYSPDGSAWELLPARACALASLPVGRGRPPRHLRQSPAPLLRPRALERARPHPEGAALRPHRARGQPRRGRQGVLLLPRRHAHPLLHAGALQVPAAGVPVRAPGRGERAARAREARVRAPRHRHLRRRPLLRRGGGVREGEPERRPGPRDRREPGAGRDAASCAADPLAPEHVVLGARRAEAAPGPGLGPGRGRGRAGGAPGALAGLSPLRGGGAAAPVHRERDRRPAPVRRRAARCRTKGRLPRGARPRPGGSAAPGRRGDEGRGPPPVSRSRRAAGRSCGSGSSTAGRRRPSGPSSIGPSPSACARPTSSTRRWCRIASARTRGASCARRWRGCSGRSSGTTTTSGAGSRAIPASRRRRRRGGAAGTPNGPISTTTTSCRCRTSGSIRGTRPGTSRSTRSRWRSSTPTSRRTSSSSSCASGTCTRTARSPPTSGRSGT